MLDNVYQPGVLDGDIAVYGMGNAEMRSQAEIPERNLWAAYMERMVSDAQGKDGAGKTWCTPCHFDDLYCGCRTVKLDGNVKGSAWNPEIAYMWIGAKRQTISLQSCAVFPDGNTYYRALRPNCKNMHTLQNCAKEWFASEDCEAFCGEHGLAVDYIRRLVRK